ncbi:extracellular solute-binding protein [Ruegeria sp.]|uniref:extracellular solute-binding protein n=1 Tax=Ruegeria sp. TaxID=1879320 RepID=UPI0023211723|nr:extracellular solute-binding protein [Ruegeria sp.]MDA7964315.1 extracellular solute-binding protein [Ruegeria sp.]
MFQKSAIAMTITAALSSPVWAEGTVNFYNWSDYIADDTLPGFTEKTGISVQYDLFDSPETLETKMLTGNSGYDLIVPSSAQAERLIGIEALAPLNKELIPNLANVDPGILEQLAAFDEGNSHVVPYMLGTMGIGYNVDLIKERIPDAPVDSLDLLFKPEYAEKLADCGIGMIDVPSEVSVIVLNYLGLDPYSGKKADIAKAEETLMAVRDHFRYFRSTGYLDDLANGEMCAFLGYSIDVFQMVEPAAENGINLAYSIPVEGTVIFFDTLAIPADAENIEEAHALINHILDAEVSADLSNYLFSPSGNAAALPLVDEEIRNDPSIMPTPEVMERLRSDKTVPQKTMRARTRMMTKVKTGI